MSSSKLLECLICNLGGIKYETGVLGISDGFLFTRFLCFLFRPVMANTMSLYRLSQYLFISLGSSSCIIVDSKKYNFFLTSKIGKIVTHTDFNYVFVNFTIVVKESFGVFKDFFKLSDFQRNRSFHVKCK